MPFTQLINATAAPAATDTTVIKLTLTEKLMQLSDSSFQQLLEQTVSGLISVSIKIVIALLILSLGRWLIHRIHNFISKILTRRNVDLSLRTFLLSLVSITLYIFLIIILIGVLGINTTSFVALFASAGVAIGMALSGTLQNFAGGVMVLLFKPYRVGDFIEAQGQTGTVKEILIFNTVLNTPDNKTIIIPNGGLSTGIINNYSKEGRRRVDWTFGIAYGDDYALAKEVLLELLKADTRIQTDPAYFIALHSLGDSSVNIVVRVWADVKDYWDIYFDLNEKVYRIFPERGLNFPFPQMDVHLSKDSDQASI